MNPSVVEVKVAFRNPEQKFPNYFERHLRHVLLLWVIAFVAFSTGTELKAQSRRSPAVDIPTVESLPARIQLVSESDIRFQRLPTGADLSQTRVGWTTQDKVGFLWFGTQYGLNRYDGYKSKAFKHEPEHPGSLSCVYVRSLYVDHEGTLWVGCDRFLDRFEPATETFAHYPIDTETPGQRPILIVNISEDHSGILWLATERGLYRVDPTIGGKGRLIYAPHPPDRFAENRINEAKQDREGRFWLAGVDGLEEFDRDTARVVRRVPLQAEISHFQEDKFGIFWMNTFAPTCALATWDPRTNVLKCHSLQYRIRGLSSRAEVSEILEDRSGTLWFGSNAGLLKFDRVHNRFLRYHHDPFDSESLESDRIIDLYQDQEGNIWTCFQGMAPNLFADRSQPFHNFTYERGNLLDSLVTSIYEDHDGILWISSMGGLNRIDRVSGKNVASPSVGNEILTIHEDHQGVLFGGTFHQGLMRIDRQTGKLTPYSRSHTDPVTRILYDQEGALWAALYGGVGRYDPASGIFTVFSPENRGTVQYQDIKEDGEGLLWLGGQNGLHRFDPRTGQFKIYEYRPNNPKSLSDNRVNSIHFDHRGAVWVGTQNGLDKLDTNSGIFKSYYENDGLAGDVVSCILEDKHDVLWMSTNKGISSFDPQSQRFQNFTVADGLPGRDLTGWGACYQSPSGEMFFGGFNGATAFYPDQVMNSSLAVRTVLTDFRLSGNPVSIGGRSPLKKSITSTDSITLSHEQNNFSIEFTALSFFNAVSNRYRYKLNGLDNSWHEVDADQHTASYTTLPAGTYTFEVQSATGRGPWNEPGTRLHIEILPSWYQTLWFRGICVALFLVLIWSIYLLRLRRLERQFNTTLETRVDERTRIARELHDTLLQSIHQAATAKPL